MTTAVELGRRLPVGAVALSATSAVAAAGVVGLADAATEHEGVSRLDPVVAADMLRLRSPALTTLAHALTFAGSEVVVGSVAVLVLAALVARRRLPQAVTFAAGLGGSVLLTVAVKLVVARPRPGTADRLGPVDTSFSFPSGHTLNSTVLLVLVVWLLWGSVTGLRRTALVAGAAVASVGVAWSRVYLGYHWLTDVVASVLVAVAWLSIVLLAHGSVLPLAVRRPPSVTVATVAGRSVSEGRRGS